MLKQLRYFQSVVRLSSFSAAAEENFISQSAISQQIQALERALGFRLLERKNRSFSLTPAGEYFYQKSLILTADYERMCREAARIAHGDRASLRIGYLRCYTSGEFHRALELFSEQHPDVDVSVTYGNHEELYALLRAGEADLRPDIFDRRAQCRKSVLPPPSKGKPDGIVSQNQIKAAEHQHRQDGQRREQDKGKKILPPGKAAADGLELRDPLHQNTAL